MSLQLRLPSSAEWLSPLQRHLADAVALSPSPAADVAFACAGGDVVHWDGLPYLATLSQVFVDGAACLLNCRAMTQVVHVRDFEARTVRNLLTLVSSGSAIVTKAEIKALFELSAALGVKFSKCLDLHFCCIIISLDCRCRRRAFLTRWRCQNLLRNRLHSLRMIPVQNLQLLSQRQIPRRWLIKARTTRKSLMRALKRS